MTSHTHDWQPVIAEVMDLDAVVRLVKGQLCYECQTCELPDEYTRRQLLNDLPDYKPGQAISLRCYTFDHRLPVAFVNYCIPR